MIQKTSSIFNFKLTILRFISIFFTIGFIAGGISLHYKSVMNIPETVDKSSFFEDREYDVFFFGSSHTRNSISPFQLWNDYGITSYNLAGSGTEVPLSYITLVIANKYKKIKIAVLDVYGCRLNFPDTAIAARGHYSLDPFPISNIKIKNILELYNEYHEKYELIFPYYSYHNKWTEITLSNLFQKPPRNMGNGFNYVTDTERIEKNILEYKKLMASHNTIEYLDNEQTDCIEYVKKFVDFCRKNEIQPVLTYLPPACGVLPLKESNSIQKLADSLGVTYYNMLYIADEIIDADIDLTDCRIGTDDTDEDTLGNGNAHLNLSGARKVTEYIGNKLKTDFNLPDHRNEISYSKWNDDYKSYRNRVFELIKEINDFDRLLMVSNFSDISVKLYKSDRVSFDEIEKKLIKQLGENITVTPISDNEDLSDIHIVITDTMTNTTITEKEFNICKVAN